MKKVCILLRENNELKEKKDGAKITTEERRGITPVILAIQFSNFLSVS